MSTIRDRRRFPSAKAWVLTAVVMMLLPLPKSACVAQAPRAFGDPLPNLSAGELARFHAGKDGFEETEAVADGIGPVFNDVFASPVMTAKPPAAALRSYRFVSGSGRTEGTTP